MKDPAGMTRSELIAHIQSLIAALKAENATKKEQPK